MEVQVKPPIKELIFLYKEFGIDITPDFTGIVRDGDPLYFKADIKDLCIGLGTKYF